MPIENDFTPPNHAGPGYVEFLASLCQKRSCRTYFEIGVSNGASMSNMVCDTAIGVDPGFTLSIDVTKNKRVVKLFNMPSDTFFGSIESRNEISGVIDIAFLDGLHTFEFLLRDFFNTEKLCGPNSLIALHDCLPLTSAMTERDFAAAVERGKDTDYPYHWTGDVWKVIPILQKYRPDLRLVFVDCPPTGLVFITNLDPQCNILQEKYLDIVSEFVDMPSSALAKVYSEIKLTSGHAIAKGYDHTLYFKM